MSDEQADLIERIRELLATEVVTEQKMFGQHCFLVRGKIVLCAGKDGDALMRVAGERHEELVQRPGAAQAEMGAGRSMGEGWLAVSSDGLESEPALREWVGDALAHNRTLTE